MLKRSRRLRVSEGIRDLVRETTLSLNDLIYPLFVVEGTGIKKEISSLERNYHYSIDRLPEIIEEITKLGIKSVILFGIPDKKDACGSEAFNDNGIVQKAVRKIKELNENLVVITDVCMCEYTDHGHCGILHGHYVDNDETLKFLSKIAVSHAKAGADMIAPSDMMDGRVRAIRDALDENGFKEVSIMAYSAKYASAFYGPFREAANSAPSFGNRKQYQMDPANGNEGLREIAQDLEEGADIVMVKPALSYLDVVKAAKERFNAPMAVYNVSGEYAMVKAAGKMGLIDEKAITMEMLLSMKRAGADLIITYFALDVARWLKEEE